MPAPVRMCCTTCGSDDVRRNADTAWDVATQRWEIVALFDDASCEACGTECSLASVEVDQAFAGS